jgi:hypothetical protein
VASERSLMTYYTAALDENEVTSVSDIP